MKSLLFIAIAGALGALARYGVVNMVGGRYFPWGTLAVNVAGSLVMGIVYVLIVERMLWSPDLKPVLMTGFLGAFTTFSAFSLEAWEFLDRGEPVHALAYIASSVLVCLLAVAAGVFIGRLGL